MRPKTHSRVHICLYAKAPLVQCFDEKVRPTRGPVTINDLSCDVCGCFLPGPAAGVRFVYHPGVPELRDDAGLACQACWALITTSFDMPAGPSWCAACGEPVTRRQSLHVRRFTDPRSWRLCAAHAVGFLNSLRTVEPKLDPATFRFPAARPEGT